MLAAATPWRVCGFDDSTTPAGRERGRRPTVPVGALRHPWMHQVRPDDGMCGVVPGEGHGWQVCRALRVGALLAARAHSLVHPGVVTTIRQARLGDEPELKDIDAATWTAAVSPAPPPAAGMAFFGERTAPGDVLVAETGHVIAGYAALGQPVPLASHSHVLEIRGLAVRPAHQRSGVGRRLVEACIEQARSRGARKLSLRVLGGNVAARRLYESCGFIAEGILREEFFLDGQYVDDVLMACMMDPAAGPEG